MNAPLAPGERARLKGYKPWEIARYGKLTADALAYFGSACAPPAGVPFVLYVDPWSKPYAFPTAEALAASIHRRRRRRSIGLWSVTMPIKENPRGQRVVQVHVLGDNAMPTEFLGLAWVGGARGGQRLLRLALHRVQPDPSYADA